MITGTTEIIAHLGFPTHTFKSPSIYNPHFERTGIDVAVVPMACEADSFPAFLRALFTLRNLRGAILAMPHKMSALQYLDRISPVARMAGAVNAVRKCSDGTLEGELFDGVGFLRAVEKGGFQVKDSKVLVLGAGGVGSGIAASLAAAGAGQIGIANRSAEGARRLAHKIQDVCPDVKVSTESVDPSAYDLIVNATSLGMKPDDPLPCEASRIRPSAMVVDVVHSATPTSLLLAARAIGATTQDGSDMLYEQIPAYLEFFGLPAATADELRQHARR